ncbi:MAG: hypothetical protein M1444_04645 [Patescibacteria group bacterium]|nr:hypothetical protein [Patescibacteria group bacterium]
MIFPPSILFLARRSGCHEIIPSDFAFLILLRTSSNFSLPGIFAVLASVINSVIWRFSLLANSVNSAI